MTKALSVSTTTGVRNGGVSKCFANATKKKNAVPNCYALLLINITFDSSPNIYFSIIIRSRLYCDKYTFPDDKSTGKLPTPKPPDVIFLAENDLTTERKP